MAQIPEAFFQRFLSLSCQLSPENLHCDGEISVAEANRKYRRLMTQWRQAEAELGRPVTEDEVWRQQSQHHTPAPFTFEEHNPYNV